ncbi:MAG: HAMP domain-containing protein, partial [Blastocatellia bacterium]|nr:HAMP domain-containing protein [Blastocatellia bacterium]
INFIISLILLAVLIRNLLKLRRERTEQRLGSKFKTKMVVFSIGISLLPAILLFFFAYGLLNNSLELWFSSPTRQFFESADYIKTLFMEREINDLSQTTRTLMRATGLKDRTKNLPPELLSEDGLRLLKREYINQQLVYLEVSSERNVVLRLSDTGLKQERFLQEARSEVKAGRAYKYSVRGEDTKTIYLVVAIPILHNDKSIGGLYVMRLLPQNLADKFEEIDRNARDRDALSRHARKIKVTNLYLLGAMTLLLIFAATWIALYVARGITVPIQALAEATQAVTHGNFATRVLCPAEDELAILVSSFNQMAAQLDENRQTLELAAEHQLATNRKLEERSDYIETILESLSTGVISLDSSHRVTTINRSALTMLGLAHPPASGTPVEQLFAQTNQGDIFKLVRRVRRLGHLTGELELETGVVTMHTAVTVTSLRNREGKFFGSVLMIEDISELIKAQRSAVWSEVARRMAHEIKNPLTPIQLSAERISKNFRRIAPILDPKYNQMVEECTAMIKQEVGTLQRMVDEFSNFARLPQAKLTPALLNEVVSETLKLYNERLDNIEISATLSELLPVMNIDKEQIKRALVNLIDNAIEAVDPCQGERAIQVRTEYDSEREIATLIVSDTGHGIMPEDKEKLFQPYFSTKRRGTGLGLAIVSHIVIDHNGRIRIEDTQPRGTTFIIELPVSASIAVEVGA